MSVCQCPRCCLQSFPREACGRDLPPRHCCGLTHTWLLAVVGQSQLVLVLCTQGATHGEGLSLAEQSCMYFVHAREAGMALVLEHLASERMGRDLGQALFYRE